jgi:hypothetical protein
MAVSLGGIDCGGGFTVRPFDLFVPVLEVGRVFDIFFEIGDGAAVGAEEVGPCWAVKNGADAFVMPDVGAGGDEEGLARLWYC